MLLFSGGGRVCASRDGGSRASRLCLCGYAEGWMVDAIWIFVLKERILLYGYAADERLFNAILRFVLKERFLLCKYVVAL